MDILNHYEIKTEYKHFCKITEYYKNGERHRDDDLPAVKEISGDMIRYIWYVNGKKHRDNDKPAEIHFYNGCGNTHHNTRVYWCVNGRQYREGGLPIYYSFFPANGKKTYYWDNGFANVRQLDINTHLGTYKITTVNNEVIEIDETEAQIYIPQQLYPSGYNPLNDLEDEFANYKWNGEIITGLLEIK